MATQQLSPPSQGHSRLAGKRIRPTDSYGLVLLLIVVDYLAVSALSKSTWANVLIVALLGATLVFALRTSQARRIWQLLAVVYLLASTVLALAGIIAPHTPGSGQWISIFGGVLLLITPMAILRRVSSHRVVTTETVLGAVCVYLLIGFSFAFLYTAIGFISATPFFSGQAQASANNYLFFSYTTLTTVGYGNLVPAGSVGQTFAMIEALSGQIYLVIVVARLVSLWGSVGPRATAQPTERVEAARSEHDGDQHGAASSADGLGHGERR